MEELWNKVKQLENGKKKVLEADDSFTCHLALRSLNDGQATKFYLVKLAS